MNKGVLFVCKDIGGGKMAIPLAEQFRNHGLNITTITEGLAAERFQRAGFYPYFQGTVDFHATNFSINAKKMLEDINPAVVIATEGSPANMERSFACVANRLKIPVVFLEDFWGGYCRLNPARPDLILVIDEYAARLVTKKFSRTLTSVVGNHAVMKEGVNCPEAENFITNLRKKFDKIFLFIGQGEFTASIIILLIQCLSQTPSNWCLIPKFHPKVAGTKISDGRTLSDLWMNMLGPIRDKLVNTTLSLPEIAPHADIALTGYSSASTTVAYNGKIVVALQTPEVMKSLKSKTGLDAIPLVSLGCATAITKPTSLSNISRPSDKSLKKLIPYNPEKAYDEICKKFFN